MRVGAALFLMWFSAIMQTGPAYAQSFDANRMQAFMRSDAYNALIGRALATIPPAAFQKCPTLVSSGSKVTMLRPISLNEQGVPNAGLWKQSFPVSGCGNDTTLNIYFTAAADGKINFIVGLPGSTQGELMLQREAFFYASASASLQVKDCKAFDVKNTRFEGHGLKNPPRPDPGAGARFRPWWETWTIVGCGKTVEVPINFEPDEKGTQITTVTTPANRR